MHRKLKSDFLRLGLLALCLLVFPLILQPTPPPAGLYVVNSFQFVPLNTFLSGHYYTAALQALTEQNISLNKEYVTAAIYFDPQPFSPRYKAYQAERDRLLAL